MWKKLVSLNLALLMLFALLPLPAAADDSFDLFASIHRNSNAQDTLFVEGRGFLASGPDLKLYEETPGFGVDGKVITSYNSKADGSGRSYPLTLKKKYSFSHERSSPAHLYAQWESVSDHYILYVGDSVGLSKDKKDYVLVDGLSGTIKLADADLFQAEGYRKIIGWETVGKSPEKYLPGQEISIDSNLTLIPIVGSNHITFHYGQGEETVFYTQTYSAELIASSQIHKKAYDYYKDNGQLLLGWKDSSGNWYSGDMANAPADLFAQSEPYPTDDYCILFSNRGFDDGQLYDALLLNNGQAPALPTLTDQADASFEGWYDHPSGNQAVTAGTLLTPGAVVYAHWKYSNSNPPFYTLTFEPDNGTGIIQLKTDSNYQISKLPDDPVMNGYIFKGWPQDAQVGTTISENKVFCAAWESDPKAVVPGGDNKPNGAHLISFYTSGYYSDSYAYTDSNGTLGASSWPENPTREGYTFQGWCVYIPGTPQDTKIPVSPGCTFSGDTNVYADWLKDGDNPDTPDPDKTYTIKFDLNYSDAPAAPADQTTNAKGELTTLPAPSRTGYSFKGWFTDKISGIQVTTSTSFSNDVTLYAHWTKDGGTSPDPSKGYTISFEGGTLQTDEDGKLTQLPPTPSKEGFTFDGWYDAETGGSKVEIGHRFTSNATIYPHWTPNGSTSPDPNKGYTISFEGGTLQTDEDGKLTELPPTPSRDGYTFDGWYDAETGGSKVEIGDIFTSDTTIYPHWTKKDDTDDPSTPPAERRYQIYTPDRTPGGSYSITPTSAVPGTRITIELNPWSDYSLDWLSASNLDTGRELHLTRRYSDEYTFVMPASDVEVEISYVRNYAGGTYFTFIEPPVKTGPNAWYYRDRHIYHVTDGLVYDGTPITRDMFLSVLYNLSSNGVSGSETFGSETNDAQTWATNHNIMPDIYTSGLWGQDKALSREQAAILIFRYARYRGCSTSQSTGLTRYSDYNQIRPSARTAMSWVLATDLLGSTSATTLSPLDALTCGQAGALLFHFENDVVWRR